MKESVQKLYDSTKVQKALQCIKDNADETVEIQKELALIPAYSNHEKQKADRFRALIEEMGYETMQDEVGNTFAVIEGKPEEPVVMVTAHLDTVFPMDTKLAITEKGSRIYCPGICDDTRGCVEVLAILKAMKQADIQPACTLLIGGDVGEEGVGNFRGVRHIFNTKKTKVDAFVSIDGSGPTLTYGAVSDTQFRITFHGPGGHSMGAYGTVNPILCMGRTIAKIEAENPPLDPFTIFNVSTVQGGTGVTSIASTCSFTMDVRSADAAIMAGFRQRCYDIAKECAEEEYERWNEVREFQLAKGNKRIMADAKITVDFEEISGSLGGVQPIDSEIVRILQTAFETAGVTPEMRDLSSTDANIPLSLGIPAATISSGGTAGNGHDISEWYDPTGSEVGLQKNLLCILALTGVRDEAPALISKTQTK